MTLSRNYKKKLNQRKTWIAIKAFIPVGKEILSDYKLPKIHVDQKGDNSSLTFVDKSANSAKINSQKTFQVSLGYHFVGKGTKYKNQLKHYRKIKVL